MLSARDAAGDPHARQSPVWRRLAATDDYPETEFPAPSFTFSRSDVTLRTPPALFGEHNDYVYRELLGLDDEERARLEADGHIATTYAPEVLGG